MKFFVFLTVFVGLASSLLVTGNKTKGPIRSSHVTRDVTQKLTCYDLPDAGGDSMVLFDYAPYLANYQFDNRASYCCLDGIWLLYAEVNYNEGSFDRPIFYAWGENYCTDFDASFDDQASSARFVGAPDGYKYDTLNVYSADGFMGVEKFAYGDVPKFDKNFGRSVIVTGCSPWTVYELPNYEGSSVCFYPTDGTECTPSFFPNSQDLFGIADNIASARRGCFNKHVVHGTAQKLVHH